MATYSVIKCDLCYGMDNIKLLTVAYGKKAWEVDLCEDCYSSQMKALAKASRKATRTTVRSPVKFKMTPVTSDNL